MQQPENSVMEGYYTCYHMWQLVRKKESLSNHSQVIKWAENLKGVKDGALRDMWGRIQNQFAVIINQDVNSTGGKFYTDASDFQEVTKRLKDQGDNGPFTIDGAIPYYM